MSHKPTYIYIGYTSAITYLKEWKKRSEYSAL